MSAVDARALWRRRESCELRIADIDREHAERRAGAVKALDDIDALLEDEPTIPNMQLSDVLAQATANDTVQESKAAAS